MKNKSIGPREEAVLLAIIANGSGAYSVSIQAVLQNVRGFISRGNLHTVLSHLELKGLITRRAGVKLPVSGGKGRIYYQVSDVGQTALQEAKQVRTQLREQDQWNVEGISERKANELLCGWMTNRSLSHAQSSTWFDYESDLDMIREETRFPSGGIEVNHWPLYTQSQTSFKCVFYEMSEEETKAWQSILDARFPAGPCGTDFLPREKCEAALHALKLIQPSHPQPNHPASRLLAKPSCKKHLNR